jgi:hypothetical protein
MRTADSVTDDAIDRLTAEFHGLAPARDILDAVHASRAELSGMPAGALPELVERLARVRLAESVEKAARQEPAPVG